MSEKPNNVPVNICIKRPVVFTHPVGEVEQMGYVSELQQSFYKSGGETFLLVEDMRGKLLQVSTNNITYIDNDYYEVERQDDMLYCGKDLYASTGKQVILVDEITGKESDIISNFLNGVGKASVTYHIQPKDFFTNDDSIIEEYKHTLERSDEYSIKVLIIVTKSHLPVPREVLNLATYDARLGCKNPVDTENFQRDYYCNTSNIGKL